MIFSNEFASPLLKRNLTLGKMLALKSVTNNQLLVIRGEYKEALIIILDTVNYLKHDYMQLVRNSV